MSADVKEEEEENAPQADLSNQLQPGDLVAGRFRIVERLAEGGMGIVYVATQEPMGRKVALKVMKQELVSDQASVKRFYREAVAGSAPPPPCPAPAAARSPRCASPSPPTGSPPAPR